MFDTAVFVYAIGSKHPYRTPCRALVRSSARDEFLGVVTADLVQEFVHQRTHLTGDRVAAAAYARDIPAVCRVLDVTAADAAAALDLFERHAPLHARDAVLAAVALANGVEHVLSPDRAFDAVPGLRRVDPLDAPAVQALFA